MGFGGFFQQSPTVQIAGLFSLISVQFISVLFYARFQVPSRLCVPLSMSTLRPLEAQHEACGKAGLVLGRGVEMGKEVVNLDGTQRQKRQQLQVQTGAERGGKATLRSGGSEYRCSAGANGFVGAAD